MPPRSFASRPRVLYASFDAVPAPKGASTHILQTVRGIAEVADVDLITLPGTLPSVRGAVPEAVRHFTVSPAAGNFLQRALEWGDEIARRLLSEPYAAVHVRSIWEGTPARLLQPSRQYALVYEVNGLPSVELKYHYPALSGSRDLIGRLRGQERALLGAARRVITQSHTSRKFLRAHGAPGDRIQVIPNGVDLRRFAPAAAAESSGPPRIVYVGTLAPWQGVPFLIEAVRLVADRRPVRLRVVGGGRKEWRREAERLVRRLGLEEHVELRPPVPPEEVPEVLREAAICAAPLTISDRNVLQGCCPLKILEYMAAGRPIAAARLPAAAEVLSHEETALLYKPDKPRRLAEALLRLLDDPELGKRLGEAARAAAAGFTWERHNAAVAALYRELLE